MIKLQTENPLLLAERERAKKYLLAFVVTAEAAEMGIVDDLINLAEVSLNGLELNEKNISLAYSRIYSDALKDALPEHVLKQRTNLKII